MPANTFSLPRTTARGDNGDKRKSSSSSRSAPHLYIPLCLQWPATALTISARHIFVDDNRIDINRVRLLRRGEPGTAYVWLAMLACGLLLAQYWFPSLPAPSLLLLRVPCRRQSVCVAWAYCARRSVDGVCFLVRLWLPPPTLLPYFSSHRFVFIFRRRK